MLEALQKYLTKDGRVRRRELVGLASLELGPDFGIEGSCNCIIEQGFVGVGFGTGNTEN